MTLAPLLQASPDIQIHAFVAMGAVVVGAVQLAAPKGHVAASDRWIDLGPANARR